MNYARADRNKIFVLLIMRVTIFDVCFHYTIYLNLMELILPNSFVVWKVNILNSFADAKYIEAET